MQIDTQGYILRDNHREEPNGDNLRVAVRCLGWPRMNAIDLHTIFFFNQFAHLSGVFNNFILDLENSNLLTWVPMTSLLWWAWFRGDDRESSNRKAVISTIVALAFITLIFCLLRYAQPWIGFRPRPMFDPQCNFQMPYGLHLPDPALYWGTTDTFPSGHAAIFAAFSIGLMRVSRPAGIFCLTYSLLLCLGRIFLGIHYPTDIIGGACIGIATSYLARTKPAEYLLTRRIIKWPIKHPCSFYVGFFVITNIVATGFDQLKEISDPIGHVLKTIWTLI